jgi:hypothetical protein
VEGAGIVLLHPFLAELLAGRGLLTASGDGFQDQAARQRAVTLLARLAFGTTDIPEHRLLLAKLLCGLPWAEPVPPVALTPEDIAACDALLAAVLGHWRALKSRSAEFLRTQFFLRDGKLEPVDRGWRLSVERRIQDVLIERLPWGLGIIRLPWMQPFLFVHWH